MFTISLRQILHWRVIGLNPEVFSIILQLVHETIGQILRRKVGDDEGEISVNMLQEFIDYNETSPFELLSEIVEGVRSEMMEVMEERKGKAFQTEKEAINNLIAV